MDFNWLKTVIMGSGDPMHPSIAHTVFVLAAVIASGIALSRIKIKGISLGMTWILFTGIAAGHFLDANSISHDTLHFVKEFGLILFVFFIGIALGILLGSLPLMHVPQAVKLGLAGGPLIVAILIGRFGPHFGLVTYTTMSANPMMREIGLAMFLAAVGLGAGEGFVEAVVNGGYMWILYGALITIIPVLIICTIARFAFKLDYFTISGVICGSQTNPIALSFMNNTFDEAQIAVAYATVYPLAMFLRVLIAQILVI